MLPTLQLSTSMASGRAAATAFCLFKCNTSMMPHSRSSAALTSPADLRSPCMAATGSTGDEKVVQDMLYRIGEMNKLPENLSDGLVEFVVDGHIVDKIHKMANADESFPVEGVSLSAPSTMHTAPVA